MPRIRGVLLDVDGTLIDSNDQHAQAWVEAFERGKYPITYDIIRPLIGMGGDNILPRLIGRKNDDPEAKQLSAWRAEIFKARYLAKIQAFPRTRDLLQHMYDQGLKLAVATSAKEDELQPLLDRVGATDLIAHQASSDDAPKSKPDGDIVGAALAKLGLDPAEVLMLGDTPYDVEAAAKRGVRVIAFRAGGWTDPYLTGALAVYADPADLLARYAESPLARR